MYANDSFFDLTLWGRIGLVAISSVLFLGMMVSARALLRGRAVWVSVLGALVLFYVFVWASPQVYYMYYRMIIPDLPLQWVIWPPPWPQKAGAMLIFQGPRNLSAHSQGVLGWCLLIIPLVKPFWRRRSRARP